MAVYTFGLIFFSLPWIVSPEKGKELTVTCKPPEVCVLPCHFQSDHSGVRVMWNKMETGAVVTCRRFGNASFVKGHRSAADEYKGRTGLYEDQVLRGNATLLLRNIKPSDEGRYNCFAETASGTVLSGIITLVVKELTVICKPPEVCVLPCHFQSDHSGVRVMWNKMETGAVVTCRRFGNASFVKGHRSAADEYKGRTGLYEDQVLRGNATLLLRNIKLSDEGRYNCFAETASGTVLSGIITLVVKELTVTCKPPEVCVLPCHFQSDHSGARVMWFKTETGAVVTCSRFGNTSFVKRRTGAADEYKGRTGLYEDQVLRGNATLLLRIIKPSDEGRYNCFAETASGTVLSGIITLVVKAPVDKVNIQQVENKITCSSQGIYPEPQLTWSTSPPSNMRHSTTIIQQTTQLLYNISSNIILPDSDADLSYSCSINTGRSRRKATLFKPTSITGSSTETTIPCTASNTPRTGLIWKFNHIQIILTQTRGDVLYTVSERWRHQVESVSESGSLKLRNLSSYHEGTYTCELSDAEETLITNTFVWIDKGPVNTCTLEEIAVGVVVVGVAIAIAVFVVWKHLENQGQQGIRKSQSEQVV